MADSDISAEVFNAMMASRVDTETIWYVLNSGRQLVVGNYDLIDGDQDLATTTALLTALSKNEGETPLSELALALVELLSSQPNPSEHDIVALIVKLWGLAPPEQT